MRCFVGVRQRLLAMILTISLLALARSAQAAVVINELDYDQPGTDNAEFIELYNNGASAVSLSGYSVRLVNGANDSVYQTITLPNVSLAAGQYFVICANAANTPNCQLDVSPDVDLIQNGSPDALALLSGTTVVDALSYEGAVPNDTEGSPVSTANGENNNTPNLSLQRCPNGVDSNDNATDFKPLAPTPGAANACAATGGNVGLCGDPATKLSTIQGSGLSSTMVGSVVNVEAVVVGDFQDGDLNGFFLQEEDGDADADPNTSEGIFVYESSSTVPLSLGDLVRVRGTVVEFNALTELSSVTDVVVCPGSPTASRVALSLPAPTTTDFERFEGMAVSLSQALTVTGNFDLGRYGSLDLSVGARLFQPTNLVAPGAPALALQDQNDRSRIILDDGSDAQDPSPIPYKDANNTRRLGDGLSSLTGVLSGEFSAYRIHPTAPVVFTNQPARPTTPASVGGRLRIVGMNLLNFFTTLDTSPTGCGPTGALECRGANNATEFDRQRSKLLNALQLLNPDVAGLMEMQNDAGATAQNLVDGLNARFGANTYAFINTGTIGTDAIKVALIYKPAKATPVGNYALLTSAVNPLFIDTKNRPSLAQTFDEQGTQARFTIVVNHLKSKGSDCVDVGDPDVGDGQGNCNRTRDNAAAALLSWLASDPTHSSDPDYLLIGDFNAYAKEDPIARLSGTLDGLVASRIGDGAYSYQFDGQSGYLDHAFATTSLSSQVTGISEWHIDADEPAAAQYDLEFKTDDPFDGSTPFAASDHDPILLGVNLTPPQAAVPASDLLLEAGAGLLLLLCGALALRRHETVRGRDRKHTVSA